MPSGYHVPGPRGVPVLGHTVPFLRDTRALLLGAQHSFGDTFSLTVLGQRTVVFLSPDATRTIYLDADRAFSSEIGWSFTIGPLFRRGLMLRDFDEHRLHRRAMQHAFRRAALNGYMSDIHDVIDRHLARLGSATINAYQLMKQLTLDIAGEVFVGLSLGQGVAEVNEAFVAMMRASVSPVRADLPGTAFRAGLAARRRLQQRFGELVRQRREQPEGSDLLSRLSHATTAEGRQLGVDEVVDHMIFLLLAAHDTTTSTLAVMLWELAQHPAWQDRVVEEALALDGQPVTMDNAAELPATGLVMKEALRMSPPVPASPRGVLADSDIDGWTIPAGTMITAASLALHRHPSYWSDPDRFDPERFGPERAEDKQHSHLFVPFGGGAHLCLGNHFAELITKAIVARLLAHHRLRAPAGATLDMQAVPIPKPRRDLLLTLR